MRRHSKMAAEKLSLIFVCSLILHLGTVCAEDVRSAPLQYISYSAVPNLPFANRLLSFRDGGNVVGISGTARTEAFGNYDVCPASSECTFMSKCPTLRRVQPTTRCEVALNQASASVSMRLPGGICCRGSKSSSQSAPTSDAPVLSHEIAAAAFDTDSYYDLEKRDRKSGHLANFVSRPNSELQFTEGGKSPIVLRDPVKDSSMSFLPGEAPVDKAIRKAAQLNGFQGPSPVSSPQLPQSNLQKIQTPVALTYGTALTSGQSTVSSSAPQRPLGEPAAGGPNPGAVSVVPAIPQPPPQDHYYHQVYAVPVLTPPAPVPSPSPQPQVIQPVPPAMARPDPAIQNPAVSSQPYAPQPLPMPQNSLYGPPQQPLFQSYPQPPFAGQQPASNPGGYPVFNVPMGQNSPMFPQNNPLPPQQMSQFIQQQLQQLQNYPVGSLGAGFPPGMPPFTQVNRSAPQPALPPVTEPPTVPPPRMAYVTSDTQQTFCGVRDPVLERSPRILGGRPSDFGAWPWMAVITTTAKRLRCGATILNEQFLITAAHCVFKNYQYGYYQDLDIEVGAFSLDDEQPFQFPPQRVRVFRVFVHPFFNTSLSSYDVALVQVAQPIVFRPHIKPVCLPSMEHIGETGTVLGWGKRKESDDRSNLPTVLQEVNMPILYPWQCILELRTNKIYDDIGPQFLCAGGRANQDACRGDSGGPLLAQTNGRFWEIVGIVSKGYGCGKENVPGIYTNIWYVKDWIQDTVAANWNTFSMFSPFGVRDRSDTDWFPPYQR